MMDESLLERVKPFWLPLVLGLGGFGFLVYGFLTMNDSPQKQDILFTAAKDDATNESGKNKKPLTVDVEGGVMKPGVYHLKAGSLMQDALIAAGGLSEHADRQLVAKNLNMAAKLIDGAKLYIPLEGDTPNSESSTTGSSVSSDGLTSQININTASQTELDSLPGVGSVTSGKIIAGRPYASLDELVQKKIVGQKVFEQIKDKIIAQ